MVEVVSRLGTSTHSLYAWIKYYDLQQPKSTEFGDVVAELVKLKNNSKGLLKKEKY